MDYNIRINTPADFSGLEGVKPRMEQIQAQVAKARIEVAKFNEQLTNAATGTTFTQRIDAQIKAFLDAGVAAEAAQRARFENLKANSFDYAKPKTSGDDPGSSIIATGAKVAGVAAILKTLQAGFSEVAEDDRAEVALKRFGVSAAEAAKNAETLEGLDLFTGDKQAAAELYGRTMNGNTRGLIQYGIFLDETATRQQRLTALQTLAARGFDAHAAANQTLTGSLKVLGKGLGDSAADFIKWIGHTTGATSALGWLNEKLGFTKKATNAAATAVGDLKDQMALVPDKAKIAAKALMEVSNAAAAAAGKIDAVNAGLAKAGKTPTQDELDELELKAREAEGASPIDIAKERAQKKFDDAQKQRINDANAAARAKAEADETLKRLDEVEKNQNADPSRQRASELARKPKMSPAEKEEYEGLQNRFKEEQDAINEQRRRANEAKSQAERVERGLPNRQRASELQRRIDQAEIERMEGEREMNRAKTIEEMQGSERDREREEEAQRFKEQERGTEAEKKIGEKLKDGGDKFIGDFGKSRNSQAALKQAREAALKRLHEMTADEAVESADDVFNEELRKQIRSDRKAGPYTPGSGPEGHRLKAREFQSKADSGPSGLDELKRMQRPKGDAPAGGGGNAGGNAQQAVAALSTVNPMLAQILAAATTMATGLKATQSQVDQLKTKVDALDQSVTK